MRIGIDFDDTLSDRNVADQSLGFNQFVRVEYLLGNRRTGTGGIDQDIALGA